MLKAEFFLFLAFLCAATAIVLALLPTFRASPATRFKIGIWHLKMKGSSYGLGSAALFLSAALAFAHMAADGH